MMIQDFQSEQIGDLAAALAKAQAKIEGAVKDKTNPYFGSQYADLGSVWDACREFLTAQAIAVSQLPIPPCEGSSEWRLRTVLVHSSGQWVASELPIRPLKNDPQSFGSALTYVRRYALAAIAGVPQIDDDGKLGSEPPPRQGPPMAEKKEQKAAEKAADKPADSEPAVVKGAKGKNWMVAELVKLGIPNSDASKEIYVRVWPMVEGKSEAEALKVLSAEAKKEKKQ